jgi:hypothetical protein
MRSVDERSDPATLRDFMGLPGFNYEPPADVSDERLQEVIDGAKAWIGGRRWSWTIVAANFLRDGRYHAGLR